MSNTNTNTSSSDHDPLGADKRDVGEAFTSIVDEVAYPSPAAYPDPRLVTTAVENAVLALEPQTVGDFGLLLDRPEGWTREIVDVRPFEEFPRRREGSLTFTDVASLEQYVNRYKTADSLAYAHNHLSYAQALTGHVVSAVTVVLDDHPAGHGLAGNRVHQARLGLVPTIEAQRWCSVFASHISQEQLLDLVVDGAAELVSPAAAELRDLVANLHAIRTTGVESVIRTGGDGTIKLTENVNLRSGPSSSVTFPEQLTLRFAPFVDVAYGLTLDVRVKAAVKDRQVVFMLTAPGLDAEVRKVIGFVIDEVHAATELKPMRLVGVGA